MVVCNRRIREAVEGHELIHIIPDSFVIRVEDMCTVDMDIDTFNGFGVHITCYVGPLINHKNRFTALCSCLATVAP